MALNNSKLFDLSGKSTTPTNFVEAKFFWRTW